MPEYVQLSQEIHKEDTVEEVQANMAQMNAQMEADIAKHEAENQKRQKAFEEAQKSPDDPSKQLQGLMTAQESLHRISSAFSPKPQADKVKEMAQKLGIEMTPELLGLGNNEAISNALVEIAVGMGKTEEEIGAALG